MMHDTITLFMTTFYPFPLFSVISTYSQGINAGLVRIPSVNPYRLPGWFLTALGVTAAIIVLLFFSETRPWTCRFKSSCDITSGWSDFRKMRSKSKSYLIVSKS